MGGDVPEVFWEVLSSGGRVREAAVRAGITVSTGYIALNAAGGAEALGLTHLPGCGRGLLRVEVRNRLFGQLILCGSVRDAAEAVGVSKQTGLRWLSEAGPVNDEVLKGARAHAGELTDPEPQTGGGRLRLEDRCVIEKLLIKGWKQSEIARTLGRSRSTIWREVQRGVGRGGIYRALVGHSRVKRATARAGRPRRIMDGSRLYVEIRKRLVAKHSPAQIAGRLRREFPDDPEMRVSHETIYQELIVRPKTRLAKEVGAALRTGRVVRKRRGRPSPDKPWRNGMTPIHDRPEEVDERRVEGHWEGDLITGPSNQSAIGTLVERVSGYTILLHLPNNHTAAEVAAAMEREINKLPQRLRRTVTWDQGNEMARHAQITANTNVKVYFCDPHSPWQRGTNENTNGLLRQYFPKGTDLSVHTADDLEQVAAELNARPRERHGWRTPDEALTELLSSPDKLLR